MNRKDRSFILAVIATGVVCYFDYYFDQTANFTQIMTLFIAFIIFFSLDELN